MKGTYVVKELKGALKYLGLMKKKKASEGKIKLTLDDRKMILEREECKTKAKLMLPCNVEVRGAVELELSELAQALKYVKAEIGSMELDDGKLKLRLEESTVNVECKALPITVSETPRAKPQMIISSGVYREMNRQMLSVMEKKMEGAPSFKNYCWLNVRDGYLKMGATNLYTMVYIQEEYKSDVELEYAMPYNMALLVTKIPKDTGEFFLTEEEGEVTVRYNNVEIKGLKSELERPKFEHVLTKYSDPVLTFECDTAEMQSIVKRMKERLSKTKRQGMIIGKVGQESVEMEAKDDCGVTLDKGKVRCEAEGEDRSWIVNAGFLSAILEVVGSEKIKCSYVDKGKEGQAMIVTSPLPFNFTATIATIKELKEKGQRKRS